ncbi:hypothetical protein DN395_00465 [Bacillus sp. AR18-7]|nr:hypothetical protein DN395_00465 [Bacillus sp. AR18-7]
MAGSSQTHLKYGQEVNVGFIIRYLPEFQHVFVKTFANYFDPHYKEALKTYAPAMFNYMKELDQKKFKEMNASIKEKNKDVLDFKWYTRKAEAWGLQTFKEWKENLKGYTGSKYDPINGFLRKYKGKFDERGKGKAGREIEN